MVHTVDIKVRGYHIDVFGHVNNSRYLEFLEEGRWAAFEKEVDLKTMGQKGLIFTVVNININYRQPAVVGDVLSIETAVTHWGSRSAIIHQEIKLSATSTVVADADVTFVIFDNRRKKTATLEGELLAQLKKVQEPSA